MANQDHLDQLTQGVPAWNQWRKEHPDILPDLGRATLSGATLSDANLSDANLFRADLSRATLSRALLSRANLFRADLSYADLSEASLIGASLIGATLSYADLIAADLSYADLIAADLIGASLIGANLIGANLIGANLSAANLSAANLSAANLSEVRFGATIFADNDLCLVTGLDQAIHTGPSTVNVNTVRLPEGETRTHFLRGTGFSDAFIEYLPSLLTAAIQFHSCFISYAHQDEALARRLYKDLQDKGVRCWFAPHDLQPGKLLVRGIEEAIHLHEKLVVLLSADAIASGWVQLEVENALHKEATTQQEILFPLRLDHAILEHTDLWAQRLRQRHIGDFTHWQDPASYQSRLADLLRHLKIPPF